MSMCSAPSVPICPPMLKRPPPMDTGPVPAADGRRDLRLRRGRDHPRDLDAVELRDVVHGGPDTAPITGVFAIP
jgi:hypothetical protein